MSHPLIRPTLAALTLAITLSAQARGSGPFTVQVASHDARTAVLLVDVPRNHVVYARQIAAYAEDGSAIPLELPPTDPAPAALEGKSVYTSTFPVRLALPEQAPRTVLLDIIGCDYVAEICYPERGIRVELDDAATGRKHRS